MNEVSAEGRYANYFNIGHNALEFVVECAQLYRGGTGIRSHTRIITLPPYAKALSQTLRESLDRYEDKYGPITSANEFDTDIVLNDAVRIAVDFEQGRLLMPDRPERPDDTQPEGPAYESSWYRDPPHRRPAKEYEQDPYGNQPPGYESWQRPGTGYEKYKKPSDQLAGLRSKLDDRQTELTTLTKQRDTLKQDIEGLEAAVTELTQIVAAYEQATANLEKDKRELDLYVSVKTPMLDVAVKEKKQAIERIIEDTDREIDEARCQLEQREKEVEAADYDAKCAKQNEERQTAAYTALKDSYKQIENKLKQLKALRDTIEKDYDDKNKTASMYFLMKELKSELATIQILPKEELERELSAAWNRLKKAKSHVREATARQDAAKEAAAKAKKTVETLTTNRRKTILDRISQFCGELAT